MIFFFYGEDTYRSYQKVKQIRDKFKAEVDSSGFNTVIINGDDLSIEKFNEAVSQAGFLSSKRLIVINNIFSSKSLTSCKDIIIEYLNKQTDSGDENFLVFWQEGKPDRRSGLFKKLSTFKYVKEFEPLNYQQLNKWIADEIADRQGKIANSAINVLASQVGNNLWLLSNEIDKLIHYKNGQAIIEQDIKTMTNGKIDDNIFNLIDAIANKNIALATKLIHQQLDNGANEQYIFSMIVRQYRIMLQLKSLIEKNHSSNELASITKLHPFVIKKTLPLLSKYSLDDLKNIFSHLTMLDWQLKSQPLNKETLLDLFIIKTGLK